MKHQKNLLSAFVLLMAVLLFGSWMVLEQPKPPEKVYSGCPKCQTVDSLALIAIYNNTNGPSWTTQWDLNQAVCTWYGINMDDDGYVTELELNNNNLVGSLPPQIGDLSRMEILQLDNNRLSGNMPADISRLSELKILFLDDNEFVGTIPDGYANLRNLQTFYLDNNQITGGIPFGFTNLPNLTALDFFRNQIDSLPDLSGLNLQRNRFNIYSNKLTFDDILPNIGFALDDNYRPQDSVFFNSTETVPTGSTYIIDLGFDAAVPDNQYQWYKDGIPFGPPSNSNQLVFNAIDWSDAGGYSCIITNPRAPLLTLYSRTRRLQIVCGSSLFQLVDTLCQGEERTVGGIVYNESNPSGNFTLSGQDRYGCDSIVQIDLKFYPPALANIQRNLCTGQSLTIGGERFDESRPSGQVVLPNAAASGCDSTIQVQLSFDAAALGEVVATLCPGEEREVNGEIFNEGRPNGDVLISNGAVSGCDSLVEVRLSYHPAASGNLSGSYCEGQSFVVNGTSYDRNRPTGTEILAAASQNGCDSTVQINLSFLPPTPTEWQPTLCRGDFVLVNGQRYDESRPSGSERLLNAAVDGCDSIVNIRLQFADAVQSSLTPTLCPGESLSVNGTTYDQSRPTGRETIAGGSVQGCDSVVQVQLQFHPVSNNNITTALCEGGFIDVGGQRFDESNPNGTVLLTGASQFGCDSSIRVELSFLPEVRNTLSPTLCPGESLLVNGQTYDNSRPNGTETISGGSVFGCDSVIQVNLTYFPTANGNINTVLCPGEFVLVNGQRYDEDQRSGTELLPNASVNGCDSSVQISLDYHPQTSGQLALTLCPGESILVNGTRYDEDNFSGTEILSGAAVSGCDSLLDVSISYTQMIAGNVSTTLCEGSSLMVNGTQYDEDNPSGTEIIAGGSIMGCDSTVLINLSFEEASVSQLETTICEGNTLLVGSTLFSEQRPSGQVVFANASANGCDSTVQVQVNFSSVIEEVFAPIICPGESILVNGQLYDQNRPRGREVLPNASQGGCDSVVLVRLQLEAPAVFVLEETLCPTEVRWVNGRRYDINRPIGTERFANASANGCDSIVRIDLGFLPASELRIEQILCRGEELVVNGTTYDESRPRGEEILLQKAANGCDSIINVQLLFRENSQGSIQPTICAGETFELMGQTFDEQRPQGQVVLPGVNQWGCDSIIDVSLFVYESPTLAWEQTLCAGEQIQIGGEVFDESRPDGLVRLPQAASFGCDSIISVSLQFSDEAAREQEAQICQGESFSLEGERFDQSGRYRILLGQTTQSGCDSVVYLQLEVENPFSFGQADAGIDFESCETEALLEAVLPNGLSGAWQTAAGSSLQVDDPRSAESVVEGLEVGPNTLYWTLSTDQCPNYSTDTLIIRRLEAPDAQDDRYDYDTEVNGGNFQFDVRQNDDIPQGQSQLRILSAPNQGQVRLNGPDRLIYLPPEQYVGLVQFQYELCAEQCSNLCDTATVLINLSMPLPPRDPLADIPNGITPNGDLTNDAFVIPYLLDNPSAFPQRQLTVFNRWGDIVFQAQPYQNNWRGTDQSGKDLPEGTYYFVLRLDLSEGLIYKGDISILR
ncbi:MAG: gliding motility-associated C-terminal domain-containing protein [Bacteroidota bacterium]